MLLTMYSLLFAAQTCQAEETNPWMHPYLPQIPSRPWAAIKTGFSLGPSMYGFGNIHMGTPLFDISGRVLGFNIQMGGSILSVPSEGRSDTLLFSPRMELLLMQDSGDEKKAFGMEVGLPLEYNQTFWVNYLDPAYSFSLFWDRLWQSKKLTTHVHFALGINSFSGGHIFLTPDISYKIHKDISMQVGVQLSIVGNLPIHLMMQWKPSSWINVGAGVLYFPLNVENTESNTTQVDTNFPLEPLLNITFQPKF